MTGRASGNGSGSRDALPPEPRSSCSIPDPPGGPITRCIRIVNPLGLHWRVAERFSRTAGRFACAVTVRNGDVSADGKSPTSLILLVALPGAELVLEVEGSDALLAVDPLAEILGAPESEDYTI
jgi:phosphocarrier protein HPr